MEYKTTVKNLSIQEFMGTWYVAAGRVTFLEKNAFNPIEFYAWNEKENRVDINFTFNKGSLNGKLKSIPQKGFIHNKKTNAHWKVSPFWPLSFDYLVLAVDEKYEWTAIGVPSQKYLWIMTRSSSPKKETINQIIKELENIDYDTKNLQFFEHN